MGERSDAASLYGDLFGRARALLKEFFLEGGMRGGEFISPGRDPGVVTRVGNYEKCVRHYN